MRILLLNNQIPPEGKGGAESVVWRLAQGLQSAGHEVHIAATTPNPAFEEVRENIPTYHLHAHYPQRWRAWLSLINPQTISPFRNLLTGLKPDVVNAHNIHFYFSYHLLKIAHDAGIPTVFSAHDVMPFAYTKLSHFVRPDSMGITSPQDYRLPLGFNLKENRLRYNPLRNIIIRQYLTHYATIRTAPSQALADAFSANDLPPFTVVHNGIQVEEWEQVDSAILENLRERLHLQGRKVILFAGRLTSQKGTRELLAAMDKIKASIPQMTLLVLSTGDMDKQIPADYAHLRPFIVQGGWLSGAELVAAYHLAQVVVTPSVIFDTFPTVNLEAMAAGVPVIATCFGGSREVVQDGLTGYIINPLNSEQFAGRLEAILTDDKLAAQMGKAGQARIREAFTLEHQVKQMVALYE